MMSQMFANLYILNLAYRETDFWVEKKIICSSVVDQLDQVTNFSMTIFWQELLAKFDSFESRFF